MMRYAAFICPLVLWCVLSGCHASSTPEETIRASETQLHAGRAEGALAALLLARVDYPEDAALLFQIAWAQQATGTALSVPGSREEALRHLDKAHETFGRVDEMGQGGLGTAARFNSATVLFQRDEFLTAVDRYEDRVQNLQRAVDLLTDLVADAPDFEEARKNLDYGRYRLSILRQSPPQAEEEEEDGESEPPPANSAVDAATTQIPEATAEVIDGSTVVLRLPGRGEEAP